MRTLVEETSLSPSDFVVPLFVVPGEQRREPIASMPGVQRLSGDELVKEATRLHSLGILAVALFPVVPYPQKDPQGSGALDEKGVIPVCVQKLKRALPSLCVITDVALDPYTTHGHDGILGVAGDVRNDETVERLAQMALVHARAGADFVAPSDMMDGRVGAIRKVLDGNLHCDTGILSYTAKYASSLYGPFREALGSSLQQGDKKSYQMNPANSREALLEATLDEEEGADILMVKPALFYLDVIAKLRAHTQLPICAYHVSGEYAMVMAAHERGMLDARSVFREALLSIKRAGADMIFSYATEMVL